MSADAQLILSILRRSIWFPALVFSAWVVFSWILGLTRRWPGSDMVFHLVGGFAMAYGLSQGIAAAERANLIGRLAPIVRHTLVISLTVTAAVFWEFAEFTADRTLGTGLQLNLVDTMSDLALGLVGASVLTVLTAHRRTGD